MLWLGGEGTSNPICRCATSAGTALQVLKSPTWTPKVCKIMAIMADIMGLGLLFYILLGCS